MTNAQSHLLTAPVKQGAEEQHQGTVHHKAANMRRLTHKPGGGGANIWAHFCHQRAAAHLQQAVPAAVELGAHDRNAVQPGEIRQREIAAGHGADHRAAGVDETVYQQRNGNNKQQEQQQRHDQHR